MDAVSEQQDKATRPPQVTYACLIVMFGSVFVVLLMWDRIAALHTLETRETLQTFLDRPELDGAGLTVTGLLTTVKVASMISAACATAMVVLGWQATRRSHTARLGLSILAVPLFLSGLVSDGFVSSGAAMFWCSGVAAAVLTLWLGPTRAWFAEAPGAAARSATSAAAHASRPQVRAPAPPPAAPPTSPPTPAPTPGWTPPPTQPYPPQQPPTPSTPPQTGQQTGQQPGQQPGGPAPQQAPWPPMWTPPPTTAYDAARPGRAGARPKALLAACIVTWAGSTLAALGLVLTLAVLAGDSRQLLDEMYRQNPQLADQGLTDHALVMTMWVMTGLGLAACLAAAAFALLLFLGRRWAWYALVVSASAAAVLFLVGALGSPVVLVFLAAALGTLGCLVRPEVRAWLHGR
jgi:hypothetical protein